MKLLYPDLALDEDDFHCLCMYFNYGDMILLSSNRIIQEHSWYQNLNKNIGVKINKQT